MKILLIGEYSNVHWTLAEGLRALGHQVTVVSDGDRWLLTLKVCSYKGVGRFVLGLYGDIEVVGDDGFRSYISQTIAEMAAKSGAQT
jgi:hypothetical protein